ncbi:MAG TPA: His/Gly/Thr/Pro-type tRNA ligase C-terminal domain-containing protein, partial [Vicinamibacteria bacterium]
RHHDYARQAATKLSAFGVRVEVDDRNEKLGYKIRAAQVTKIPYMLVVGDKEVAAGTVSLRHRQAGDLGVADAESLGMKIAKLASERAIVEEAQPALTGGVQ